MGDVIRLLPDSVANQIAAGEVIQRPSSVIKELVENAIDADATQIQITVYQAGKASICVTDNGKGMSETDARLSFERHATSKIKEATDLFALRTMGFRGEALASIAAVAQVSLKTRQPAADIGTRIIIEGSKVMSQQPIACAQGTTIEVNNLFFNIPVRRKFLKSDATELHNILTEFERIALVYPHIAFTVKNGETLLSQLSAVSFKQRIIDIFGKKFNYELLPLHVETLMINVDGFVAMPRSARKKGWHQYFFVNGRYMKHPYFHKAILTAYDGLLPTGEQISYFVNFTIEPARIDVNIHPTKTEIKFEDEQAVWQILQATVKETLGRYNQSPAIDFSTDDKPAIPAFNPVALSDVSFPLPEVDTNYNPFATPQATPYYNRASVSARRASSIKLPALDDYLNKAAEESQEENQAQIPFEKEISACNPHTPNSQTTLYLQLKGQYILTSVRSGLLLIDQRRAHVRILFDKYKEQLEQKKGTAQGLLFPEVVKLTAAQRLFAEEVADDFAAIGFSLSFTDEQQICINGVPAGTEGLNAETLLLDMIDTAMQATTDVANEVHTSIALSLARQLAVLSGQQLTQEEMADLVEKLFLCPMPTYTPDGKLILTIMKEEEITAIFG